MHTTSKADCLTTSKQSLICNTFFEFWVVKLENVKLPLMYALLVKTKFMIINTRYYKKAEEEYKSVGKQFPMQNMKSTAVLVWNISKSNNPLA